MAMNTSSSCLVSAMDRLWYHHIILGSDPFFTFIDPTSPFTKFPNSCPSPSSLQFSPSMDETTLPSSSSSRSVSFDDISFVSQEDSSNYEQAGKRESIEETPNNNVKFSVKRKLKKSISCKSLGELELEEVKGFMDLGFEFNRENLSPQMVKLLPGLQRLKTRIHERNLVEEDDDDEDGNGNENDEISRPYLSESWTIIKRPNSHILNLRMPKVSSACDMKKHLKSWAKTVASEIP